jgi:hypothetical protein
LSSATAGKIEGAIRQLGLGQVKLLDANGDLMPSLAHSTKDNSSDPGHAIDRGPADAIKYGHS